MKLKTVRSLSLAQYPTYPKSVNQMPDCGSYRDTDAAGDDRPQRPQDHIGLCVFNSKANEQRDTGARFVSRRERRICCWPARAIIPTQLRFGLSFKSEREHIWEIGRRYAGTLDLTDPIAHSICP